MLAFVPWTPRARWPTPQSLSIDRKHEVVERSILLVGMNNIRKMFSTEWTLCLAISHDGAAILLLTLS